MATPTVRYRLDADDRFIIEGYNWAKAFSNFFPGIAGKWGVPLWAYYVSKGQAVCSVGYRDKNGQILEFDSFNKASLRVPQEGYRTFLRLDGKLHEAFRRTRDTSIHQQMAISPGELELVERNEAAGYELTVTYFPIVNRPVGGFVREVRLRNTSKAERRVEWVDGVGRILPSGMDQNHIKFIARHIEAMMGGIRVEGFPLFRLKQSAADSERIEGIQGGNYYVSLHDGAPVADKVVVDPDVLFGEAVDIAHPWLFEDRGSAGVLDIPQLRECKTPCAFTVLDQSVAPGQETTLVSIIGQVERDADLETLIEMVRKPGFLEKNRDEGRRLLAEIMDRSFTVSAEPAFDAYCRQNFLDNVMRGGMPLMFETARGKSAFYAYSRQNGDLERDYHFFVLEPGYLSQGTGHYRSVLQNRRMDGWFWPEVKDANLHIFLDLMQLDGYNPLEVDQATYRVVDENGFEKWLEGLVTDVDARGALKDLARKGFTPGAFIMAMERATGPMGTEREDLVTSLLRFSEQNELGALHEGFWVDHWTYNLDLLDTYLAVWPDRIGELLLGEPTYRFFDDPDIILPRAEKTVLVGEDRVRRYGAVVRDQEKADRIAARDADRWSVRTSHGEGEVYYSTLLVKLLVLLANRVATLDPSGIGVDMEADKPGWNDSMNGLPGIFGSALNETLELLRLARFMNSSLEVLETKSESGVPVFEELALLIEELSKLLEQRLQVDDGAKARHRYWEASNDAKERYRESTRLGVSGKEKEVGLGELRSFSKRIEKLLSSTLRDRPEGEVRSKDGVPYTYFVHRVASFDETQEKSHQGLPLVEAREFERRPVRLFLEGPVHWMKVLPEDAKSVYDSVKNSPLFDVKLGMYKSCEDMTGEDPELGRAVGAYPRGWIENESIYLHMEYKYLLEVLRSGLSDEFFEDMRSALMPFQPPERYGRSILEGASFVVSSAFADEKHHGQAFQPRLSGITCEFVHMWTLMVAGPSPFQVGEDGKLELCLQPRLAEWLFTKEPTMRPHVDSDGGWKGLEIPADAFAFKLLGQTLVVYHNPSRRSTFGSDAVRPAWWVLEFADGRREEVHADRVVGDAVQSVRSGKVRRIDIELR